MIEVRPYNPEDLNSIYKIECECFNEDFRWDRAGFEAAVKRSHVWICDMFESHSPCAGAREMLGFLVARAYHKTIMSIDSIDVLPQHRRNGVARRLIETCEEFSEQAGYRTMNLQVAVDNPAQTLYFKCGYRIERVQKDYYFDGSSAIIMRKPLAPKPMDTKSHRTAVEATYSASTGIITRRIIDDPQRP